MDRIKREDNLGPGQEHDIIWLLWQRNAVLTRQLKEWEIALEDVKADYGTVTHGLKVKVTRSFGCVRFQRCQFSQNYLQVFAHQ